MGKKIQLSIPSPCHEDWNAMTPSEKGKFCGSCQKQVIDFSRMSDREIAQFFKKKSTGSVCGRFMNDQLERDMDIPKKRIPWLKYFFQFALPAFLVSCKSYTTGKLKTNELVVQERVKLIKTTTTGEVLSSPPEEIISCQFSNETELGMVELQGDVICTSPPEFVKPFPETLDVTQGVTITKIVDENSDFDKSVMNDSVPVEPLLKLGEIKIDTIPVGGSQLLLKPVKIFNDTATLPDVILTSYGIVRRRAAVGGAVAVIHKQTKDILIIQQPQAIENNSLKIYPNPVRSGNTITLEWKEKQDGYHSFQLITVSGQTVFARELFIDKDARVLNIQLPSFAAGSYFLVLVNKKSGKKFSQQLIIQ